MLSCKIKMPRDGRRKCQADKCNSTNGRLFRFPKDPERCQKWLEFARNKQLEGKSLRFLSNYGLCAKHFSDKYFTSTLKTRLYPSAVPTKSPEAVSKMSTTADASTSTDPTVVCTMAPDKRASCGPHLTLLSAAEKPHSIPNTVRNKMLILPKGICDVSKLNPVVRKALQVLPRKILPLPNTSSVCPAVPAIVVGPAVTTQCSGSKIPVLSQRVLYGRTAHGTCPNTPSGSTTELHVPFENGARILPCMVLNVPPMSVSSVNIPNKATRLGVPISVTGNKLCKTFTGIIFPPARDRVGPSGPGIAVASNISGHNSGSELHSPKSLLLQVVSETDPSVTSCGEVEVSTSNVIGMETRSSQSNLSSVVLNSPADCEPPLQQANPSIPGDFHNYALTNKEEGPFSCIVCGQKFPSKNSIVKHYAMHYVNKCHLRDKPNGFCNSEATSRTRPEKPHICSKCKKGFVHHAALARHRCSLLGKKPYICGTCGQDFAYRASLKIHCSLHGGKKLYSCHICGWRFVQKHCLIYHRYIHTKKNSRTPGKFLWGRSLKALQTSKCQVFRERPYRCDKCNKSFTQQRFLTKHKKIHITETSASSEYIESMPAYTNTASPCLDVTEHVIVVNDSIQDVPASFITVPMSKKYPEENKHTCGECGKKYAYKSRLRHHEQGHRDRVANICSVCDKSFFNLTKLKKHFSIHTGEKPFVCDVCGHRFRRKSNLIIHYRRHTGEKPFLCNKCSRCFSTDTNLKRHLRQHAGEKPHVCGDCGKCFAQKVHLQLHIVSHSTESPYSCNVCGKKLRTPQALKWHSFLHSGEKPIACDQCPARFVQRQRLIIHKRTHTGERPYLCSTCGKRFISNHNLRLHQSVHSGERPYLCSTCGKSFISAHNLRWHECTHSNEKPYLCTTCGRSFAIRGNFERHSRTHTDMFPCSHCGRSFRSRGNLIRHVRTHTGEKPYCCELCGKRFTQSNNLNAHLKTHIAQSLRNSNLSFV